MHDHLYKALGPLRQKKTIGKRKSPRDQKKKRKNPLRLLVYLLTQLKERDVEYEKILRVSTKVDETVLQEKFSKTSLDSSSKILTCKLFWPLPNQSFYVLPYVDHV